MGKATKTTTTFAGLEIAGLEELTTTEAKKTNGGLGWWDYVCAGFGTGVAVVSGNQQYGINVAKFFSGRWSF